MTFKYENDDRAFNLTPSSPSSSQDNSTFVDENYLPAIKRRRRFTADETRVLEKEYDINSSPNQQKIQAIANSISTPRKIVTTWFQNRRAKHKRKEKLAREGYQDDDIEEEEEEVYLSKRKNSSLGEGERVHYFDSRISSYDHLFNSHLLLSSPPTHDCMQLLNSNNNQAGINYRPIMPITHQNQFFSGQEPYFPYHQHVNEFNSNADYFMNGLLDSSAIESENNDTNTLYINPADIYLNYIHPSDTEQQ